MAPLNSYCTAEQITLINACWKNLRYAWNCLCKRGYYLPDFKSKCITGAYLFGVVTGAVFSFKRDDAFRAWVAEPPMKKDLLEEIARAFGEQNLGKKILGFNEESYPDDQYMLDLLLRLKSDHPWFE
jgi:hypothetical protein